MKKQIFRLKELKSIHSPTKSSEDNYDIFNDILKLK